MRRIWISLLGFTENAKGAIGMAPVFLGMALLLCAPKLSQFLGGTENEMVLSRFIIVIAFSLWGVQGIIFAVNKESPGFMQPMRGKAAIVSGVVFAIVSFAISLWMIFATFSNK